MDWLNYHHLYYFWKVAQVGSISIASNELKLSQPTVSVQIKQLENALQTKLFSRHGRSMQLTADGKVIFNYAKEIFSIGEEVKSYVQGNVLNKVLPLKVGVSDILPKNLVAKLLLPISKLQDKFHLMCEDGSSDILLAELAIQDLDIVLSDCPIPYHVNIKAYNHKLGSSPVDFVIKTRKKISHLSLEQMINTYPIVLPSKKASLRSNIDKWLEKRNLTPNIIAEFDDSALMKVYASQTESIIAIPSIASDEVCAQYGFKSFFRTTESMENFYLISIEKRVRHPAVSCVLDSAKSILVP